MLLVKGFFTAAVLLENRLRARFLPFAKSTAVYIYQKSLSEKIHKRSKTWLLISRRRTAF